MRVGIDLTALLPEPTGVDVSLTGLVRNLARVDAGTEYVVFANREDRGALAGLGTNVRVVQVSTRPRAVRLAAQQVLLPALSGALRLDVLHSPSFVMPLLRGPAAHVLTIHDMTSFSRPECHVALRRSASYRRAVALSARRADLVTVPSRWVKDDVLARLPGVPAEHVRVVPWGVSEEFRPRPAAEARRALAHLALPPSFALFVGTLEPRKNLPCLIDAFAALVRAGDVAEHLVIAGRPAWGHAEVVRRIADAGLEGRVHLLGYVAQQDLAALYAAARLFVYPSLEEGFGFPPLEAMACGTPTVVTATSSLRENLHGAAELVPVGEPAALADAMRRLLHDDDLRFELAAKGIARAQRFGWTHTAHALRACYAEVAGARSRAPDADAVRGGRVTHAAIGAPPHAQRKSHDATASAVEPAPERRYSHHDGMQRRLGIDLGGTKIEGVVLADDLSIVARKRIPTERQGGYAHIVDRVALLVHELLPLVPGCRQVGIGTPGALTRSGTLKNSNTTCLNGAPLLADLERRLGLDVRLENDANCFALAETYAGAARGHDVVFGVILGTGVGGGIVLRGEVWPGPQRIAGEWGHHTIDPLGPACYCGQRGCVETLLSGPALEAAYRAAGGASEASAADVAERAAAGEARAVTVFDAYLASFGRALANVVSILDPSVVVLGGGLSNLEALYTRGRDEVARHVFNDELATPIVKNQLGDSAGVVGAALLAAPAGGA